MPADRNLAFSREAAFNTEIEVMQALLITRPGHF